MKIMQDPVSAYKNTYRDKFRAAAEEFIDLAAENARIDIAANEALASELYVLIYQRNTQRSSKSQWLFFLWFLIIGILGWGAVIWYILASDGHIAPLHWAGFGVCTVISLILIFLLINPRLRQISAELDALNAQISAKTARARAQLAPLFDYFGWKTFQDLISGVMPELQFEDFLTAEHLRQLDSQFDFALSSNEDVSLLTADSGTFYGYPFLLARVKDFDWGTKDWTGSLEISWRTREKDADGKYYWKTHYETLYATLTKPYPEFSVVSALCAGHTLVPSLTFSRSPSDYSGEKGFWANLGKKFALHRLHRFAQNLQDSSNYTMMSNREFEVLFHSTDRSDEIAFRQLFTPLAQEKMVKLLNDKECSYGDDFVYSKNGRYTMILPEHLRNSAIAPEPFTSDAFDFAVVKNTFLQESCEFFRSVYFTFAPLLAIPAYVEPRLDHETPAAGREISAAEIEAAANFIGEGYFAHPESITQDILKVKNFERCGKTAYAEVSALGFKGVEHLEHVSKFGGDGKWHQVPVRWVEYIPVRKTTTVCAAFAGDAEVDVPLCFRRGIICWRA